MTNQEICYQRDNKILSALTEQGVLDAEQLQYMFFPSRRMAQKRLYRLWTLKKLRRGRMTTEQPFYYHLDKSFKFPEHRIGLNWAILWLQTKLSSWEQITLVDYEPDYGVVRPDAYIMIKNNITGKKRGIFIEHERHFDKFDKVKKYNTWYESRAYVCESWAGEVDKFPTVLIVADKKITVKNNYNDINFQLMNLSRIIEEVRKWKQ